MSVPVLTGVTGAAWEARLVAALERGGSGLTIVRRCVDLADLLAAAASGQARAVLLSADLRRLDREALGRLTAVGVAAVGLVTPGDEDAERRLRQLGLRHVLPADASPAAVVTAVLDAVGEGAPGQHAAWGDPLEALPHLSDGGSDGSIDLAEDAGSGRLVAVWGPTGAPGRTTVAVGLASELAALGRPAMIADADTFGGVVAQMLGLLDESPGLAAAARAANNGQLDLPGLARHARQVQPRLRVLTGIARAERWTELRPAALEVVWSLARRLVDVTVVDCGFSLEQDEEISYDTTAPRRNGATLLTLERADVVIAVGTADPVGIQRLVRGLSDLREAVPGADTRVLVNRLRRSSIGGEPEQQVRQTLARHAGVTRLTFVPYDRAGCDAALVQGRTLAEVASDSPARRAIASLAADLVGATRADRRRRDRRPLLAR